MIDVPPVGAAQLLHAKAMEGVAAAKAALRTASAEAEKAVAVPEKLMENKIAMGISVLSCLVAGFSDKLKGNAKPTQSTTRSKRR